jgi:hypothetical protein
MEGSSAPLGTAHWGLAAALVVSIGAALGLARLGFDGIGFVIIVLVGWIGLELAAQAERPLSGPRVPRTVDLGGGWRLVDGIPLERVYLDAIRAWCWISARWDPMWRPKTGGHKTDPSALRPRNAAGSVNRLLAAWIVGTGSGWTHSQLLTAMRELGLVEAHVAGGGYGWSPVPMHAANERLWVRIGGTIRRAEGDNATPSAESRSHRQRTR